MTEMSTGNGLKNLALWIGILGGSLPLAQAMEEKKGCSSSVLLDIPPPYKSQQLSLPLESHVEKAILKEIKPARIIQLSPQLATLLAEKEGPTPPFEFSSFAETFFRTLNDMDTEPTSFQKLVTPHGERFFAYFLSYEQKGLFPFLKVAKKLLKGSDFPYSLIDVIKTRNVGLVRILLRIALGPLFKNSQRSQAYALQFTPYNRTLLTHIFKVPEILKLFLEKGQLNSHDLSYLWSHRDGKTNKGKSKGIIAAFLYEEKIKAKEIKVFSYKSDFYSEFHLWVWKLLHEQESWKGEHFFSLDFPHLSINVPSLREIRDLTHEEQKSLRDSILKNTFILNPDWQGDSFFEESSKHISYETLLNFSDNK
jgi:hypothetical protein